MNNLAVTLKAKQDLASALEHPDTLRETFDYAPDAESARGSGRGA
jgi:hypothetical protein